MKRAHRVTVLVYDGVWPFELAIAIECFGIRRPEVRGPWYRFEVCTLDEGRRGAAAGGITIHAKRGIEALRTTGSGPLMSPADVAGSCRRWSLLPLDQASGMRHTGNLEDTCLNSAHAQP